ncbi:MAG TPA: hypothetical protein VKY92_14615 [Verrucomicrobiae bacterium]|jgi:hypothetical protein|nr:hypothetical protein [Verrucomicrobiae bacterium]
MSEAEKRPEYHLAKLHQTPSRRVAKSDFQGKHSVYDQQLVLVAGSICFRAILLA